jgi:hypothetical protein
VLLVKEEKRTLKKVSVAVQGLLCKLDTQWTGTEISRETGIANSRISEYRDYKRYQRPVSLNHLIKFVGGGFFTMQDIIDKTDGLTVKEQDFLRDLGFYEDPALRRSVIQVKREAGVDALEVYNTLITLKEAGEDVKNILDNLRTLREQGVDVAPVLDNEIKKRGK